MYLGKNFTNCEHGTCNSFSKSMERRCRTWGPRPPRSLRSWRGLPPVEEHQAARGHGGGRESSLLQPRSSGSGPLPP